MTYSAMFTDIIAKMKALDIIVVRFSSDSVTEEFDSRHGSVIIDNPEVLPEGATLCRAYENDGKCNGCRACYDKGVAVIAYPAHGVKMRRVINIMKAKV